MIVSDVGRQARAAAEDADAHALALQPVEVAVDIGACSSAISSETSAAGPAPVLGREAEHGQPADAQVRRGLDGALQRLDAGAVAQGARQAPRASPSGRCRP